MRAKYGSDTPTGHGGGLPKFQGGPASNKSLKSAFRTRRQDATAGDNGHQSPHTPTPGLKKQGGERLPCPQA